jgi:hypothetical protein
MSVIGLRNCVAKTRSAERRGAARRPRSFAAAAAARALAASPLNPAGLARNEVSTWSIGIAAYVAANSSPSHVLGRGVPLMRQEVIIM